MKDKLRLRMIYDRTSGYCHICHRKVCFTNYGKRGMKGAWHIEHSIPKANGGTDHLNNLYPACVDCNHEKGVRPTASIRMRYGISRAPYSRQRKEQIREENTIGGMIGGGLIGARFGPLGMVIGSIIGGFIGEDLSPNK